MANAQYLTVDNRVEQLLSQMTLEEKLGQMNQLHCENWDKLMSETRKGHVGSVMSITDPNLFNEVQRVAVEKSRLGIPLISARDVIHGFKTIFPIPLGQAASFHPEAVEQASRVAAIEASAAGIRWTFAPMIDITHDPRWGRIAEGFGEDPYLVSEMGKAAIRGFQGEDMNDPTHIAACAKHFAAYGAAEGGRDYNSTFIPERRLRNLYLRPFEAAVQAEVATFMSSFNDNDGIPASGNKFLLTDILRKEWGFNGFAVSDWDSVIEMVNHGFCADGKEAAMKAINAGLDMEMVSETYINHAPELLKQGRISITEIDNAVRNILRVKFQLGLFEQPYVEDNRNNIYYAPSHLEIAQTIAEESIVLLKNESRTLPLQMDQIKTILVTGPLADAPHDQLGTWVFDGDKKHTQTPLNALQKEYGNKLRIIYEPGLAFSRDTATIHINRVVQLAKDVDVILAFVGEESILSGEAHSLTNLNLQGAQTQLLKALSATKKPLVTICMAGRPLTIGKEVELSDALLYAFHPGTMGGPAIANLLTGKTIPSGKLPVTFPKTVGQIPLYYNHNNTGRPANGSEKRLHEIPVEAEQTSLGNKSYYLDEGTEPLFPFGYGLSYTEFSYANLKLSKTRISPNESIIVSFDLTNTGLVDGTETALIYFRDLVASTVRPIKELVAFKRVGLRSGEKKHIDIEIPADKFAFWNIDMQRVVEPGTFEIMVGADTCRFEVITSGNVLLSR